MQYRHTISSIMGQRDSTDTDCFGKGNSTAVNEICAVNSSIQRITQIQQSRLEYQMKDTQSPSQDMYSIDYDVDNVIDQLLAEQFSTWGGGSMSTTVSGGGVHEMRIRSISHNEVSSADQAGMGSPILWRMNS